MRTCPEITYDADRLIGGLQFHSLIEARQDEVALSWRSVRGTGASHAKALAYDGVVRLNCHKRGGTQAVDQIRLRSARWFRLSGMGLLRGIVRG